MLTHIQWMEYNKVLYGIEREKQKLKTLKQVKVISEQVRRKKKEVYKNRFINKTRDLFIILIAILEY